MVISDFFIGFHDTILFTWGSVALIAVLGFWVRRHKNIITVLSFGFFAAILFFIITNFGTWLMSGLYPLTSSGLEECFILAVPFFRATLFSTVIYSLILFGAYEILAEKIKATKLAGFIS